MYICHLAPSPDSAQILRIYLHIYLASEGCAPRPLLYVKHIVNQLFLFLSGSKI